MNIIQNRTMDEERALYGLHNAEVVNCEFSGPLEWGICIERMR